MNLATEAFEAGQMARENALVNNYDVAIVYYELFFQKVNQLMQYGPERRQKWLEPYQLLLKEYQEVKELQNVTKDLYTKLERSEISPGVKNPTIDRDVWPSPLPATTPGPSSTTTTAPKTLRNKKNSQVVNSSLKSSKTVRKQITSSESKKSGTATSSTSSSAETGKSGGAAGSSSITNAASSSSAAGKDPLDYSKLETDTAVERQFECKGIDASFVDAIETNILQKKPGVYWSDIAGLQDAKDTLKEIVMLPRLFPQFFRGIRKPWKGVLLFGPPGTGKTMLAKAAATECNFTFFNLSLATITSKYRGDSEKLITVLFEMARFHTPSIIFIDEVDSLCSSRSTENEHEASRRAKSEFLKQIDGIIDQNAQSGQVLILCATNFPWDLDRAFLRRLEKKVYVPLPNLREREELLKIYLKETEVEDDIDFPSIAEQLDGYSGSDIMIVCKDASLMKIRSLTTDLNIDDLEKLSNRELKLPISMDDFRQAFKLSNKSITQEDIEKYDNWNKQYAKNLGEPRA